jgi:hypothetical protein
MAGASIVGGCREGGVCLRFCGGRGSFLVTLEFTVMRAFSGGQEVGAEVKPRLEMIKMSQAAKNQIANRMIDELRPGLEEKIELLIRELMEDERLRIFEAVGVFGGNGDKDWRVADVISQALSRAIGNVVESPGTWKL